MPTQLQQVSWEFRGEGVATEAWAGLKGTVVVRSCGKAGKCVSISGYSPVVPGTGLFVVLILSLGFN